MRCCSSRPFRTRPRWVRQAFSPICSSSPTSPSSQSDHMTSPTTPTFDLTPPRRPGIDDVGGGAKLDDQSDPPDPVTMPTAADDNQKSFLVVKVCGIVPVLEGSVHFAAGVPAINQAASMAAVVDILTISVVDN